MNYKYFQPDIKDMQPQMQPQPQTQTQTQNEASINTATIKPIQKGGYDFTDLPPDGDPSNVDPYEKIRFWIILDILRSNYFTR